MAPTDAAGATTDTAVSRPALVLILGAALVATIALLILMGENVGVCLGPLNVTLVQCAAATGIVPRSDVDGSLLVIGAGVIVAAALFVVARPIPRDRRRGAAAAGILAALVVASLYLALRPKTMEGPTSTGAWISIAQPLDPLVLAVVLFAGAAVAIVAWGCLAPPLRGSARRSP